MASSALALRRSGVNAALRHVLITRLKRVHIVSRSLRQCRCRQCQMLLLHEALEELFELVELSQGGRQIVADARAVAILVSNGLRHVLTLAAVVVTDFDLNGRCAMQELVAQASQLGLESHKLGIESGRVEESGLESRHPLAQQVAKAAVCRSHTLYAIGVLVRQSRGALQTGYAKLVSDLYTLLKRESI